MNIVILGANGKVGSMVTASLLEKGHAVTASVHKNKSHVPDGAVIKSIDITDIDSVTSAISGADAVVCALSSWKAPTHDVLASAMRTVIPAMNRAGITRIVSISGDVARAPNEKPSVFIRLFHTLVFGTAQKVIDDSEDHLRQLYESNLDWTVLRPTIMSSSDNPHFRLTDKHPVSPMIPRKAVVAAIVELVETNTHLREAPFISGN